MIAMIAALVLYYQFLALNWAELPPLPTLVDWVLQAFALLPVLGTPGG